MESKEFFTTGEVSKIIGIARKTVKNYCDEGKLRCEKAPVTNYRRIPKDALLGFMKENSISLDLLKRRPAKILIVEDEPSFREYMAHLVSTNFPEATVKIAADGYEACMTAMQFVPDTVILDLKLPKEDGMTVCEKIKENERTKHAEIVVVTGHLDENKRTELHALNIRHIFLKPLEKEVFLKTMHVVVKRWNNRGKKTF